MTIHKSILIRLQSNPPKWVFSSVDFLDIASRNAIDVNLHRLAKENKIRKLTTGLYDCPQQSDFFGLTSPDTDQMAQAYARKFGYTLSVHPAYAAHILGISTQVPSQFIYLTNGPSKTLKIQNVTLKFIHASPKKMVGAGTNIGLIIQALYYIGRSHMNEGILKKISSLLTDIDKKQLMNFKNKVATWLTPFLMRIINHD